MCDQQALRRCLVGARISARQLPQAQCMTAGLCELMKERKKRHQGTLLKAHQIIQPSCLVQNLQKEQNKLSHGIKKHRSLDVNDYAGGITRRSPARTIYCR